MRARLHPEAELQSAAQWYEDRVRGLGERFLAEAVDAFIDIEKHPERFPLAGFRTTKVIRRRRFDHFPHSIVYEVTNAGCLVVAITHAKRRPGYWKKRLG